MMEKGENQNHQRATTSRGMKRHLERQSYRSPKRVRDFSSDSNDSASPTTSPCGSTEDLLALVYRRESLKRFHEDREDPRFCKRERLSSYGYEDVDSMTEMYRDMLKVGSITGAVKKRKDDEKVGKRMWSSSERGKRTIPNDINLKPSGSRRNSTALKDHQYQNYVLQQNTLKLYGPLTSIHTSDKELLTLKFQDIE